jgi:glycosyltransferase involved in cell wall biosynthesis
VKAGRDPVAAPALRLRIFAFPRAGYPYTERFYAALEALGVEVIEGQWSGRWLAERVRPGDVVHLHWPSFFYDRPARTSRTIAVLKFRLFLRLIQMRGGRLVWTAHNLYPHDGAQHDRAHRAARRLVAARASRVLVHSQYALARVSAEFAIPKHKMVPVPHGHLIDYFPRTVTVADARARLGIGATEYVYGFVGTCMPYKRVEDVIDAFGAMQDDGVLLIAGGFRTSDYLALNRAKLARLHGRRIIFEPRDLAVDEMQIYMQASDILVCPYRDILTSGTALTAFSFGTPVIVPDNGAMRESVPAECGIVYDAARSDGLYQAMLAARARRFDRAAIESYARTQRWSDAAAKFVASLRAE